MKKYFHLLFITGILGVSSMIFLLPLESAKGAYVCYPNCDAYYTCVNDSCGAYGLKATAGDKISLVNPDLKLAAKVTIGDAQINNWRINN